MTTSFDPLALAIIAAPTILLFVWVVLLQISFSRLKRKLNILFSGKKGEDLEKVILGCQANIAKMDDDIKDLFAISAKIQDLSFKGLHKVGMIRFNPFRDIGGDQSFSVALLDGKDNGVVISSLYSREGVRIYAKSIQGGTSQAYQLTEEEKHAIKIASSNKEAPVKKSF